jgi:integral membrane protein
VNAALARYRVLAYIVGVALLVLTAAIVVKYAAGDPSMVEIVGPIHGFLYIIYLVIAFDLSRRMGWRLERLTLVLLAGTIPFVTFAVERWVTHRVRERLAAQQAQPELAG